MAYLTQDQEEHESLCSKSVFILCIPHPSSGTTLYQLAVAELTEVRHAESLLYNLMNCYSTSFDVNNERTLVGWLQTNALKWELQSHTHRILQACKSVHRKASLGHRAMDSELNNEVKATGMQAREAQEETCMCKSLSCWLSIPWLQAQDHQLQLCCVRQLKRFCCTGIWEATFWRSWASIHSQGDSPSSWRGCTDSILQKLWIWNWSSLEYGCGICKVPRESRRPGEDWGQPRFRKRVQNSVALQCWSTSSHESFCLPSWMYVYEWSLLAIQLMISVRHAPQCFDKHCAEVLSLIVASDLLFCCFKVYSSCAKATTWFCFPSRCIRHAVIANESMLFCFTWTMCHLQIGVEVDWPYLALMRLQDAEGHVRKLLEGEAKKRGKHRAAWLPPIGLANLSFWW